MIDFLVGFALALAVAAAASAMRCRGTVVVTILDKGWIEQRSLGWDAGTKVFVDDRRGA